MTVSPPIIFRIEAHTPKDTSARNDFFRCKSSANITSYLQRQSAADRRDENSQNMLEAAIELNQKLDQKDIISYAKDRPGSTGLFDKNGDISPENVEKNKEILSKTKSIIWSCVLSFTPELAAKCCNSKNEAQRLLDENIKILFKNNHLDENNMNWFGAFHINTKHPHIHFVFWENEPKKINKFGTICYNNKYKIPQRNIDEFKFAINKKFLVGNTDYFSMRDDIRSQLKIFCSDNQRAFYTLYQKAKSIMDKNIGQYGRLEKSDKSIINNLVKTVLQSEPKLNKLYNKYCDNLLKTQNEYRNLYLTNHMKVPNRVHLFYDSRVQDLQQRLGSQLYKMLKEYHSNNNALQMQSINIAPTNRYRHKLININNRYVSKQIINIFLSDAQQEILVSQNQLDKYRAELHRRGEELIDEEESTEQQSISS